VALATVLFAVNGRPVGCDNEQSVPGGQCPQVSDTRAGAWTAAGIGLGATALGVYLLLDRPSRQKRAWLPELHAAAR